ncbi:MAG: hypothetical protein Q7T45_14485, partial [Bradyrhizobium sp.]|nr:hypothetical protein [Bradyrhizobium sp.]
MSRFQSTSFSKAIFSALVIGAATLFSGSAAHSLDCSDESSLKSVQAGGPVELAFRNASTERRRLYWIDPNGERKFNGLIEGGNLLRQTTSTGHSWVVTDDAEKCLFALTATADPVTIDVGGVASAQLASPPPGVQQPIAAAPPASPPPPPVVQAPVAPQLPPPPVAAAAPQAAMAQLPQISPIEQFQLSGVYRIAPRGNAAIALNSQASGTIDVAAVKPEWDSGQWTFEAVPGSPFVRIKNQWKKTYLTDVGGKLRATAALPDADEAHWSFEPVDGTTFIQFRNRETDRFLIAAGGAPALVDDYRQDQEAFSQWQVSPASRAVAAAAPRNSAYDAALSNCRELGGYWTGSSCRASERSRPLVCPRGYAWSEDFGECQWDGGSCPPWQMGPGGRCMTDLSCRGGVVEISRRGYPACYCPVGMVAWGDYPRLSCVPSIARIAPLLLGTVFGVDQGRPQFGQIYGNKRFCGPGKTGTPPNCVVAQSCPPPLVGTPPNCTGAVQVGQGCPPGTTYRIGGNIGKCVPDRNPVPTPVSTATPVPTPTPIATSTPTPVPTATPVIVATPTPLPTGTPNPVCAIGQTNVNGVCTNLNNSITCTGGKIEQGVCGCPAGTTLSGGGRNFQCVAGTAPKVCPAGTSGPNCAPDAPCDPRTQTGTPGKCVEKVIPCSGGTVDRGSGTCSCPSGLRAVDGVCTRMSCSDGVMLGDQCRCNNPNWVAQRTSFSTFACVGSTTAQCPSDSTGVAPSCTCKTGTSGQPGNCKPTSTIAAPNTNPRQCSAGENPQAANCLCPNSMNIVNNICTAPTIIKPNTNPRQCSAGENPQAANCLCPNTLSIVNGICTAPTTIKPNTNPRSCSAGENPQSANCLCPNTMSIVNGICTAPTTIKPNTNPRSCNAGENPQSANCLCKGPLQIGANGICSPPSNIRLAPAPQACPAGTTGTFPNCVKPAPQACPAGTTGTFPNCVKPAPQACPAGTTGTFPNCVKPAPQACPAGTTGTFPNCVRPPPQACP